VESLVKSLSQDNLFDRLVLAFMYNSDILQAAVLDLIAASKEGVFTSIMASSKWFHFTVTNEELAKQIIKAVYDKLDFKH
jgi:hypothetical protein